MKTVMVILLIALLWPLWPYAVVAAGFVGYYVIITLPMWFVVWGIVRMCKRRDRREPPPLPKGGAR